ncbi:MAG: TonB-dependent receptor plug domain-containing protein, partial [Holophaga sp.]|nr:TonB-dependent receptor plug domain-containing protein [Holophaga sp.]
MLFALAAGLAAAPQLALAQPVPQVRPGNRVETRFDVPGGPLGAALDRFARTAGISLPYDPALVAERTTRGLEGSYGVAAGLAALLAGTDLEPVAQAGGRFTVRRKPEAGPEERADTTLREVKVSAQAWSKPAETPAPHKGGQVARGARLGILGNVDLMDAPFNVTAYTEQTIVDQQSVTVGEVLRNDPSVRFTTPDGHNAENFTIRGFDLNSSELAFNGMYGMLSGAHVPTEFLERVEIFRGPSAMLSGMSPSSAVGGVINLVPKRAGSRDVTRLTTKYASGARLGLAADIGRRFGGEKRLGIRFNGTHSDGETPLDGQKKREQFASLGVDYLGDRWTLDLDAYVSRQNQTNGSPLMVGFATLGQVLEAPDSSRNALRGTFARQDTQGAMVRGEFELS